MEEGTVTTGAADKLRHEERAAMKDDGQPALHVFGFDVAHGRERTEWAVWLNTGVADFDGLCIGIGPTRDAAVADAVKVLEWAEGVLQGPPPDGAPR